MLVDSSDEAIFVFDEDLEDAIWFGAAMVSAARDVLETAQEQLSGPACQRIIGQHLTEYLERVEEAAGALRELLGRAQAI